MVVISMQALGTLPEYRVGIGKSIYGAVQYDAFLHPCRKLVRLTVNTIGYKIAYFKFVVVAGKVYVC